MKPRFSCLLCHCSDAPRYGPRSLICADCAAWMQARGLAWCARGRHQVKAREMGSKSICKACEAAYSREKYFANHEARKASQRAWHQAHPERAAELGRRWRLRQKMKIVQSWQRGLT